MRSVIILSGINGSGKTTYANRLREDFQKKGFGCEVISSNDFFHNGFDPNKIVASHADCFQRYISLLLNEEQDVIIVDNTNVSHEDIAPYTLAAIGFDWEIAVHTIECSVEEAYRRTSKKVSFKALLKQQERLNRRDLVRYVPKENQVFLSSENICAERAA